jgi:hypothetical protein
MSIFFRNFARTFIAAFSLLAVTGQGGAASYFVDYGGGTDANPGTSTIAPWQHCPGDPSATGTAASTQLSAGDTVLFKGGVSYVFTAPRLASSAATPGIALSWAGTPANPIVYDGNSAGTWGAGKAVLTDQYSANNICAFYSSGDISNLIFQNFMIGPIGGAATLPPDPAGTSYAPNGIPAKPGGGISCGGEMNNIVISGCGFSDLGYYGWTYPLGNISLRGGAIGANGCNGVTITNCTMTRMRDAIYFSNSNQKWPAIANLTIAGCTLSFIEEWGVGLNTSTNSYMSNVFISNCLFTNVDQSWSSWGGYSGPPHRDTIFSFGSEGAFYSNIRSVTDTNVNVCNNVFVDTLGNVGGTATVWFEDNASANIYNNVFINTQAANGAVEFSWPSTNSLCRVGVYNNTFYLSDYQECVYIFGDNDNTWAPTNLRKLLVVENNIFYEWSGAQPFGNAFCLQLLTGSSWATNSLLFNYNLYRTGHSYLGQMVYGYWSAGLGYINPINSRSAGWDTNSITGEPRFVSASGSDFHLTATSQAVQTGVNLTSLNVPGLSSDKDGNLRPAAGPWSLGAYQFGTNAPPPAPQNLHVVAPKN